MKQALRVIKSSIIVASCCGVSPVFAQTPPDVHVCGSEPASFDQSHYAIGRPERHQRSLPPQLQDAKNSGDGSKLSEDLAGKDISANEPDKPLVSLCKAGAARSKSVCLLLEKVMENREQSMVKEVLDVLIPEIVIEQVTGHTHCYGGKHLEGEKLSKLIKPSVDTKSWMYLFSEIRKNSADVSYYYRKYTDCLSRFQNVRKRLTELEVKFQKPLDSQNLRGEVETLENLSTTRKSMQEEVQNGQRLRANLVDLVGADAIDIVDKQLNFPELTVLDAQTKHGVENRVFHLYKASIYNSMEMQRHLERMVKRLEYDSGRVESTDEVIWSFVSSVIFVEHPQPVFTVSAKDAYRQIQHTYRNRKSLDQAGMNEAHTALMKLARQVVASFRGYERQVQLLEKYRELAVSDPAKVNEKERQRSLVLEDHYRFRLIQLAGFEAVEQMEREPNGSAQSQSFVLQ